MASSSEVPTTEYGTHNLSHAGLETDERGEWKGQFGILGRDGPVLLLAWLLFAMPLASCVYVEMVLGSLALGLGLGVSVTLICLSAGRGSAWEWFSRCCCFLSVLGLALGIAIASIFPPVVDPLDADLTSSSPRASFVGLAVLVFSISCAVVIGNLLPRWEIRLIGTSAEFAEEEGWGWHPEVAKYIIFGWENCSLRAQRTDWDVFPEKVSKDLLDRRMYWSGEPAFDYIFHVCNDHTFLSCAFSHPAHPFEKAERVFILASVVLLLVLPVAACSVVIDRSVRTLAVLIVVTGPRNLLKLGLKHCAISADQVALQETQSDKLRRAVGRLSIKNKLNDKELDLHGWRHAAKTLRVENAFWWEVAFFAFAFVAVGAVCFASISIIQQHQRPVLRTVLESCDGIGYAFVLEMIFDLAIPGKGFRDGQRHWGFFAKWASEKDYKRECSSRRTSHLSQLSSLPEATVEKSH